METIEITVPGRPVPQARPRVNTQAVRRGRGLFTFLPAKVRNYQKLIASHCPKLQNPVQDCVVSVFVFLHAPVKKSIFSLRPDIDNFLKSAFDGLQAGGVIADDSYIMGVHSFKIFVGSKKEEKLKIEEIITSVEKSGGSINILSSEHPTGQQIADLGSIVGILRYKIY